MGTKLSPSETIPTLLPHRRLGSARMMLETQVIRNAEWALRDRSRAGMLAGSMEGNKRRHTGGLQLSHDKDNQISSVLKRGPEVEAVVGDYQITNLSLLLNLINSSLPKGSTPRVYFKGMPLDI
ncbi:hypothetical protein T03_15124 [Trichinella britovi]|uniref:Uncharacterized protein n=1 Tax=Trichinella britovi TaxID=45882 RepID=A0A0V1CBB1_TRIBR|nr:hypothetical protein T03_15124 [Trichinella britovi]